MNQKIDSEMKEFGIRSDQIRQDYMRFTNYDWKASGWDKFMQDTLPVVMELQEKLSPETKEYMKTFSSH